MKARNGDVLVCVDRLFDFLIAVDRCHSEIFLHVILIELSKVTVDFGNRCLVLVLLALLQL